MKYKVTFQKIIKEEQEIIIEKASITEALDEARELASQYNNQNKSQQYYFTKITEI